MDPTTTQTTQANGQQIQVRVPDDKKTGTYSNIVSLSLRPDEVTFDFGFILPGSNPPMIEITNRVTMNMVQAKQFLGSFQNAVLDMEKKIKDQNQQK